MRKELDDLLVERYPDLFCERQASPIESGTPWLTGRLLDLVLKALERHLPPLRSPPKR